MARIFRRRRRGDESSELDTREAASDQESLPFEPPRRGAARASTAPARAGAEDASVAEVARLREELKRERAENARVLADAERRLAQALAEQRLELEAEAHKRVAEVARLASERAEIESALITVRRQLQEAEPHLTAVASDQVARG